MMIPNDIAERREPGMMNICPANPLPLPVIMPKMTNPRPIPTVTVRVNNAGQAEGLGLATEKGLISVGVYE